MRSFVCGLFVAPVLLAAPSVAAAATDLEPPACSREVDALFWGGAQPLAMAEALGADPSPCVDAAVTIPPTANDRTVLMPIVRFNEVRALGVTPVAEIRWTSSTGWREWVVGTPGRTFYQAGQTARRRMAQRGLDVTAGETWAFNELTPEVLAGAPGARAEVLEFLRGLYDGDPGMPKARGIVFNIGLASTAGPPEVAAYKAALQSWLADEAFWAELDLYVDVFANEVYASSLSWGVSGIPFWKRAKRLNEYFQHMAILAEAAPKGVQAARAFLGRTHLALANAAWPHPLIGDTHLLDAELMSHFVSTQTYALREFAEGHPNTVPQGLVGFAWAPILSLPGYSEAGRDEIAARLANAVRLSAEGVPKDACGPATERVWCEGEVENAWFNPVWRSFETWD